MDFLSSIIVFAYLAGPIALIVLRLNFPDLPRNFKTKCFLLVGYAGFACCGLLIYWSGLTNLILIVGLLIILSIGMSIFDKQTHALTTLKQSLMIILYMIIIMLVSYAREKNFISFPADNLLIIIVSIIFGYILVKNSLSQQEIGINLAQVNQEIQLDNQ